MPDDFQPDTSPDDFTPDRPDQSFGAALHEFGRKMNPVAMAQGIAQNVAHPVEAVKRWGEVNNKILSNAEDAYKRGDYTEAAAHTLYYALNGVPGLGEALDEAGTKLRNGDIAGGLADTAALGTQTALGIKAPAIAEAAPSIPAATAGAIKGGIQGGLEPVRYGHLRLPLPASAAGAAAGHYIGRFAGAPEAGAIAGAAYPVVQGAIKGAKSALAARAAEAAPGASAAGAAAAETLADGTTVTDILKGQGVKGKPTPEQIAGAQSTFDKLKAAEEGQAQGPTAAAPSAYTPRPPEYYGVKAAEVPPSNPASAPPVSAQPASAAASTVRQGAAPAKPMAPEAQDIDFQQRYGETEQPEVAKFLGYEEPPSGPKPASTAASVAKAANAKAKGDRFVSAIQQYNERNTVGGVQPITADAIASLDDAGKSVLTRALIQNGYLRSTERFTDTSFPYILQGLRDAEAVATRQTIRPPAGFSMGAMKNY